MLKYICTLEKLEKVRKNIYFKKLYIKLKTKKKLGAV